MDSAGEWEFQDPIGMHRQGDLYAWQCVWVVGVVLVVMCVVCDGRRCLCEIVEFLLLKLSMF
jgi:hypothetical protein